MNPTTEEVEELVVKVHTRKVATLKESRRDFRMPTAIMTAFGLKLGDRLIVRKGANIKEVPLGRGGHQLQINFSGEEVRCSGNQPWIFV